MREEILADNNPTTFRLVVKTVTPIPSSPILLKTWNGLSDTMLRRLADYKARLNVALQHPPNARMIRRDLAQAQAAGFDPKTLWEQALRSNEDSKYPPPAWKDVNPNPVN